MIIFNPLEVLLTKKQKKIVGFTIIFNDLNKILLNLFFHLLHCILGIVESSVDLYDYFEDQKKDHNGIVIELQ